MRATGGRQLVAQLVIVVAGAMGASAMIVGPLESRLAEAREHLDAVTELRSNAGMLMASAPAVTRASRALDDYVEGIRRHSELSENPSRLHEVVMELADRVGVRIDRVQPGEPGEPAKGRSRGARAPVSSGNPTVAGSDITVRATRMSIEAVGAFENIADFIDALEKETGFARIVTLRMTPMMTEQGEMVRATIQTEHLSFQAAPEEAPPGAPGLLPGGGAHAVSETGVRSAHETGGVAP